MAMTYVGRITDTNFVEGRIATTLVGECETAANVADKVVDCNWFSHLMLFVELRVMFHHANTAANPTLNVNNTGALPIFNYGTNRPQSQHSSWDDGEILSFTYIDWAGGVSGWWMNNRRVNGDNAQFFAVVSDSADTAWKTITVSGLSELKVGTKITVMFTYGNTVDNVLSGKLPIRVIGDGLDTGNSSMANSVIETSPILDAGTVVTLVCTSTVANAIKWRVVASETVQKLTTTSGQIHPMLIGANTGDASDIADASSDLYKDRFTPNMLYPKCVGVSDGGAFISKYLYNYMVFDPNMYELLTSAPSDWTTKWFTYYTKSGSTYSNVTGNASPTFQTNTYYRLKYESTTGYVISANQFGTATRRYDGSRYNGPLIKGYSGKSTPTGDGGQLAVVSGNGLTIVSGGEYGDMLAGMIDDCQAGYKVTTSQPSNWSTNYKYYFRKSGDYYVHVDDETAPTWAESSFYYGPERLNLFTDSDGNPSTSVGANLRGDSDSLILASDGAIFFVGPAGTSSEYRLLLAEPYDWSSNWTDRYQGNVYTKSGSTYTAVTSSSAPSFQYETYYMLKEIRRGIYFHPGTANYSSRPRLVPSENGTALLGAQANHWRAGYIDTVYGELNGTIASSTTATTQSAGDNSTKVATTAYVDSSIAALDDRYGSFEKTSNYSSAPWAKLCYYTTGPVSDANSIQRRAVLLVTQYLNETTKMTGILVISSCTKATAETSLKSIEWLVADPGINTDNFVLVETDSVDDSRNTATYELWVKVTANYQGIIIKPIIETNRNTVVQFLTFVPDATGAAEYTQGTSTLNSSLTTLKNDISGLAATASLAVDAVNVDVTASNPTSQTTYYVTFQQNGTSKPVNYNNGLTYATRVGSSNLAGVATLSVGNSTSSTLANGKTGLIYIYGAGTSSVGIRTATLTASRSLTLPDRTGTVAVTDQLTSLRGGTMLLSATNGDPKLSYWGRVASCVIYNNGDSVASRTYSCEFLVSQARNAANKKAMGILQAAFSTTSSTTSAAVNTSYTLLNWMFASGNIDPNNFAIVAYNDCGYESNTIVSKTKSIVFELWVKGEGTNALYWTFKPLSEEYSGTGYDTTYFTFYKVTTSGTYAAQAALPSGSNVSWTTYSTILTPVT